MPPTLTIVALAVICTLSATARSSEELTASNKTEENDIKHRVTRSDIRAALGDKVAPGFWPARGRRSNSEETPPPFWANRGRSLRLTDDEKAILEELMPFWKEGSSHLGSLRLRRKEPLYADEPTWVLLGRRDEQDDMEREDQGSVTNQDDPFWVARGRRRYEMPFEERVASYEEDAFLPSRGRRLYKRGLRDLISAEEPFWASRGKRAESSEELFWSARAKKGSSKVLEDFRSRRGLLASGEEPFWAARGKKAGNLRRGFLNSLSSEEPFWAARGRRAFLESLSADEPFWAARGKKNSPPTNEDALSQIRAREAGQNNDPWWPVRGKRVTDDELNPEDERFWRILDVKIQNNSRTS